MSHFTILTDQAPKPVGPYSQGVSIGNLIFTAGQIGINPVKNQLRAGVEAQTRQTMQNLKAILEAAGSGLEYTIKTTIFLVDMNDYAIVNEIYGSFFPTNPPGRSTVQVSRLPLDASVEIEAIAHIPS